MPQVQCHQEGEREKDRKKERKREREREKQLIKKKQAFCGAPSRRHIIKQLTASLALDGHGQALAHAAAAAR